MKETKKLNKIYHLAVVLIRDVNMSGVDWKKMKADIRGRTLLETVQEEGMEQMVSFNTHIRGNCLDLVITNFPEKIITKNEVGRL